LVAVLLIAVLIGFVGGRFLYPPQPKVETVEKIVEKKEVVEVIKELIKKDGTTVRTIERQTTEDKKEDRKVKINKNNYDLSIQYGIIVGEPVYGIQIQRRIFGDFKLGVWGNTKNEFGISLGIEF
jgi:hypothetical protein